MNKWSTKKSVELFKIEKWGQGYFEVNTKGNLCVKPSPDSPYKVDLKRLIDELRSRKVQPPVLIRVMDILKDRLKLLSRSFNDSIKELGYKGKYFPLYPIKVNQQRTVVEAMLKYGQNVGLGLEAGSKAELLLVLALTENINTPIVCNGYKDEEFVELVGMAHKMGKKIIPVIENYSEVETFIRHYKKTGVMPNLGIRLKLFTKGAGQWASTGGESSKFGLRVPEVVNVIDRLAEEDLLNHLKLLHFHIGSQITDIKVVKNALTEASRVFIEMIKLGANLEYIDVGGGLGVDYDGSARETFSTINYTLQEYTNDVVYRIQQVCDQHGVPHPTIFSESGRFLAAHYSLLITNIQTTGGYELKAYTKGQISAESGPLKEMIDLRTGVTEENYLEAYHDAIQYRQEVRNLFNYGYVSLRDLAGSESLFSEIMEKILEVAEEMEETPEELWELQQSQVDTYFANFSLFQSLPDSWAIDQVFPIIPVHQLGQKPTRKAVLVDLTCDSDGKITDYIGDEEDNSFVHLHEVQPGDQYYVGIFMIGAYQETLGELHNLFGDTHSVQIEILGNDKYRLSNFTKGDSVKDVLGYVAYNAKELIGKMRAQIERAVERKKLTLDESAHLMDQYEEGMFGYTYFEE
ncbi:MAG: biosynthetic arginine decarboxylase [Acidobacteria bacterium]|nr:biosynthetic arginine decarboxylase [Acidobacteriota bacterium]MCB9396385.1 biosynthetic arginine decarboxylase [Acidobacteriota bacterium]